MRPILGIALLLALTACGPAPVRQGVTVEQAWVQLPAIKGRPGSAYFTLRSAGGGGGRLIAVTSARVERIELHETRTEGGIARMTPLRDAAFNDIGEIAFTPGSKHAMLFGIDPDVTTGSRIPLTFAIEPAGKVTVDAEVRAFGAGSHAGH